MNPDEIWRGSLCIGSSRALLNLAMIGEGGWVQEPPLKFKFVQLVHTTYLSTACQISSGRPAAYS